MSLKSFYRNFHIKKKFVHHCGNMVFPTTSDTSQLKSLPLELLQGNAQVKSPDGEVPEIRLLD